MLQKIKLKNFQSLKDVTLSLGRVTIIRGASDVGKSAIIRGLNAFFDNSFNPEYAHHGQLPFGVAIQKNNRVAFGRRTPKGVEYKFDSVVYSKTAKKIPQDISDFLGIYPYSIDVDMDVFFQIQKQWDRPFLLMESSITVAKIIGRISNLNIVLMAMREMFAAQLENKQEVNFLYSRKTDLKNQLLKFSNFDDYEKQFSKAVILDAEIEQAKSERDSLSLLIEDLEKYNAKARAFKAASSAFDRLQVQFSSAFELASLYLELKQVIDAAEQNEECYKVLSLPDASLIRTLDEVIELTEQRDAVKDAVDSLILIEEKSFDFDKFDVIDDLDFDLYEQLNELVSVGSSFNQRLKDYRSFFQELSSIEQEYESLYDSFTKGKTICPFSKLEMQPYCKEHLAK